MFSYTGLQPNEVDYIESHHKIFMTRDGRVSIAGLTEKNICRVACAIVDSILKARLKKKSIRACFFFFLLLFYLYSLCIEIHYL
jgi:hypothetical protein